MPNKARRMGVLDIVFCFFRCHAAPFVWWPELKAMAEAGIL